MLKITSIIIIKNKNESSFFSKISSLRRKIGKMNVLNLKKSTLKAFATLEVVLSKKKKNYWNLFLPLYYSFLFDIIPFDTLERFFLKS
jgi:hypothetical protein